MHFFRHLIKANYFYDFLFAPMHKLALQMGSILKEINCSHGAVLSGSAPLTMLLAVLTDRWMLESVYLHIRTMKVNGW